MGNPVDNTWSVQEKYDNIWRYLMTPQDLSLEFAIAWLKASNEHGLLLPGCQYRIIDAKTGETIPWEIL